MECLITFNFRLQCVLVRLIYHTQLSTCQLEGAAGLRELTGRRIWSHTAMIDYFSQVIEKGHVAFLKCALLPSEHIQSQKTY